MNDPIVDEVRRARDEHAKRFNYDLTAICDDIRKRQSGYGDRLVRLRRRQRKGAELATKRQQPAATDG